MELNQFFLVILQKVLYLVKLVHYRYVSTSTVGQESLWKHLDVVLENNFVEARSWRILDLNKMLVAPGFHAIIIKLIVHFVCQNFITCRTSLVAANCKITENNENRDLMSYNTCDSQKVIL